MTDEANCVHAQSRTNRRFGSDAFLTDGCHLLQNLLSWRLAWRPQQSHGEMEDDVDEEVVTKYNQH